MKFLMPIAIVGALIGCTKSNEAPSVSYFLHDIDQARVVAKDSKNIGRPNAQKALSKIQFLNDCFPTKDKDRFSTSNTDHTCLDNSGYKV